MAKIFLSIPVLDRPELKMMFSCWQAMMSCKEHQVRLYFNENDSLISRVRNVHISTFLNDYTDCDYYMSIDSDLEIVNCFQSNNIFSKLISHDKDFIGGLYALKQTAQKPQCSSIPMQPSITRDAIKFDSGVIEMRWLSSGCWCIKRSAVEKMVKAYPELTYVGDDNAAGKPIYGLFIPNIFEIEDNGRKFKKYLSEDWAFTERWRSIGGKIYADTSIVLRHIGKQAHNLWDIEVVSKQKNVTNMTGTTPMPQPKDVTPKKELPPAGFDLIK